MCEMHKATPGLKRTMIAAEARINKIEARVR